MVDLVKYLQSLGPVLKRVDENTAITRRELTLLTDGVARLTDQVAYFKSAIFGLDQKIAKLLERDAALKRIEIKNLEADQYSKKMTNDLSVWAAGRQSQGSGKANWNGIGYK